MVGLSFTSTRFGFPIFAPCALLRIKFVRLMHFALVRASRRGWIVPIGSPRRMIEVDHKITVVRNNRVVESKSSDLLPVTEAKVLGHARTTSRALVRRLNVEDQFPFGGWIASVKNMRHHFVTKIQILAINPQLIRRNCKAHKVRTPGRFAFLLAQLGNLIELP